MSARAKDTNLIDETAFLNAITSEGKPPAPVSLRERLGIDSSPPAAENDSAPPAAIRHETNGMSRELRVAAKVLEHNFKHLTSAEEARDVARRALNQVQQEVEKTSAELKQAIDSADGELHRDIDPLFERNLEALERLETVAAEAAIAIAWHRQAWRLYAQSKQDEYALRAKAESGSEG